jgi:oxygen-independent coproporphyrinogen-3 oxidase
MITDRFGLYVHIPYCVRKCNYCDFCSLPNGRGAVPEDYVEALVREISSYCKSERMLLDTLYFGGGTPSLLSPEQLGSIMSAIRDGFDISPAAEITFEANPGTLTLERARAFKSYGFNRVSLGLQSIHDKEMKKLGRIHSYDDFLTTYEMLRKEKFDNVSVDLMYGIPHQTKDSFEQTLRAVVALSPEHISVYGLIVEEGTPFFDDEALELPTLDEECDMYDLARSLLAEAGYEHYEISNYARNGYRSRHNSLYWNLGEYIGVGAAAHSFIDSVRYCNTSEVSEYIASASPRSATDDNIDAPFEYAMLKLRMSDGFSLSEYEHRFKRSFTEGKDELLSRLAREGLVILDGDRIALTERGFYLSNSILVEIL